MTNWWHIVIPVEGQALAFRSRAKCVEYIDDEGPYVATVLVMPVALDVTEEVLAAVKERQSDAVSEQAHRRATARKI
jgi:hypothetical protein